MLRKYNPEDYISHENFLVRFVVLISFAKIKDLLKLPNKDDFLDINWMW